MDLKSQGKLTAVNVEEISISSKRKRSISFDQTVETAPENNVVGSVCNVEPVRTPTVGSKVDACT